MRNHYTIYKSLIKPFSDWLTALVALIILTPWFVIIAILIKLDSRGSVFFKQERLGLNGKPFKIIKFRSMRYRSGDVKGVRLFEDDPRITPIGRIIRMTSLDELPQLINILKGDMSFIGPRPPLTYYPKKYKFYNAYERERFNVKPGLSGLAQVRCRDIHDWNVKIPIDVEYVHKCSFFLDSKLFLISILSFFRTHNIYDKR